MLCSSQYFCDRGAVAALGLSSLGLELTLPPGVHLIDVAAAATGRILLMHVVVDLSPVSPVWTEVKVSSRSRVTMSQKRYGANVVEVGPVVEARNRPPPRRRRETSDTSDTALVTRAAAPRALVFMSSSFSLHSALRWIDSCRYGGMKRQKRQPLLWPLGTSRKSRSE